MDACDNIFANAGKLTSQVRLVYCLHAESILSACQSVQFKTVGLDQWNQVPDFQYSGLNICRCIGIYSVVGIVFYVHIVAKCLLRRMVVCCFAPCQDHFAVHRLHFQIGRSRRRCVCLNMTLAQIIESIRVFPVILPAERSYIQCTVSVDVHQVDGSASFCYFRRNTAQGKCIVSVIIENTGYNAFSGHNQIHETIVVDVSCRSLNTFTVDKAGTLDFDKITALIVQVQSGACLVHFHNI